MYLVKVYIMSSSMRSIDKQERGTQPTGFWAHGTDVMCFRNTFCLLAMILDTTEAEDKGTAPAPCAQPGYARTQLLLPPLHIKLCVTLEIGQDQKALTNLEFINYFFCSLEKLH